MPNHVTTLNPYKSSRKSSAESPLTVEKGPGLIVPNQAKLWPFKECNRQICPKIGAEVPLFVNHFQMRISQA